MQEQTLQLEQQSKLKVRGVQMDRQGSRGSGAGLCPGCLPLAAVSPAHPEPLPVCYCRNTKPPWSS